MKRKEIKQNVIMTSIASWLLTSPLAMRIKSIEIAEKVKQFVEKKLDCRIDDEEMRHSILLL